MQFHLIITSFLLAGAHMVVNGACLTSSGTLDACVGCSPSGVNDATAALIKEFEGFNPYPVEDPVGLPTVGYGHSCKRKKCAEVPYKFPLTTASGTALLHSDLRKPVQCLSASLADSVQLNANQYGAFASWVFNIGCGAARSSALISRLNKGEDPNIVAEEELPQWNKGGGRVVPKLVRRRAAELKLFRTPSLVTSHPPPC